MNHRKDQKGRDGTEEHTMIMTGFMIPQAMANDDLPEALSNWAWQHGFEAHRWQEAPLDTRILEGEDAWLAERHATKLTPVAECDEMLERYYVGVCKEPIRAESVVFWLAVPV
jgi:hypothetical protein